jgi:hypothetical protein
MAMSTISTPEATATLSATTPTISKQSQGQYKQKRSVQAQGMKQVNLLLRKRDVMHLLTQCFICHKSLLLSDDEQYFQITPDTFVMYSGEEGTTRYETVEPHNKRRLRQLLRMCAEHASTQSFNINGNGNTPHQCGVNSVASMRPHRADIIVRRQLRN